jgi:DNA-binding HxlR family transcriptional regulator
MAGEKNRELRSDCPVNFAVEIFGDKWSLLIVRDIVFWGRNTYGAFLKSTEKPATNILADRLARLEREGVVEKKSHSTDKRKEVYSLTEKGLDLIPILLDMAEWSLNHGLGKTFVPDEFIESVSKDKAKVVASMREKVLAGDAVFWKKDYGDGPPVGSPRVSKGAVAES